MNVVPYAPDPDGFIRHWLACGVITSPLTNLERVIDPVRAPFAADGRWVLNYWAWSAPSLRLKRRVYATLDTDAALPFAAPPIHQGVGIGGQAWRYVHLEEDGAADFSRFNFTPTLMEGWLYAEIAVDAPTTLHAELHTVGPARVYLGDRVVQRDLDFSYVAIRRISITLDLPAGTTPLYLHTAMLGWREARCAVGLRLLDDPANVRIQIPIGEGDPDAWQRAEDGLAALTVTQFAFPTLPGYLVYEPHPPSASLDGAAEGFTFDAIVELPLPDNLAFPLERASSPRGESRLTLGAGERGDLPIRADVTAGMSGMPGENSLTLTLRPADGTPLTIKREIWSGAKPFSTSPYGAYDERRREALEHLAAMPYDVPAALAALELRTIDRAPSEAIALACHFMENRYDCADFYAVGLLALIYRHAHQIAPADDERIRRAFIGFKYWIDEPGLDAMCYFTENHQILFHVAQYLAGQHWLHATFTNSGRTGLQQMKSAMPRIREWIRRRLASNFSEWDSNAYLTLDAFAMLALAEFAMHGRMHVWATALLDKIFFMLACQSYRGALGSTHGRCYVTALKSARIENTSALGRIAWGMGMFNGETRATGLLALARRYRVPDVIQRIGADSERTLITQARSRGQFCLRFDMRDDEWDVTTLTHRTPDGMLSAALDYQPGAMGIQEHLWQATLSPEAAIFTTYPGNSSESGNARPNFWAGSARLPRVAMHGGALICIYRLESGVGMGFTHAYFPTAAFDEWMIDGRWAFARVSDGYAAVWGDGDLALTARGRHAGQELRSGGRGAVWGCCIGRRADDGTFADFRARVKAGLLTIQAAGATWVTPDGDALALDWETPFTVNGAPHKWDDSPHYRNRYTDTPMNAERMQIAHDGLALTLDLKHGRRAV
jgi:hypothetical protein